MASPSRLCVINGCKRPSRALCICCQKYVCRDHLKEHDDLLNAQLPPLADQINLLSDHLNNIALLEPSHLTSLDQWREAAHRTVDQFCDRKRRQFEQIVQERRDKQKKDLDQMRVNVSELIREQEATKEQIDSITESIRSLERDVNNLQHIHFNNTPLVIDDNLIFIGHDAVSKDLLPPLSHQTMQSTVSSFILIANNESHLLMPQKSNIYFSDMLGNWIDGIWIGTGFQPQAIGWSIWTIRFTVNKSKSQFLIEYPSLGSSGVWNLLEKESAADRYTFKEIISNQNGNTVNDCKIIVTKVNDNYMSLSYFSPPLCDKVIAWSTLKKLD